MTEKQAYMDISNIFIRCNVPYSREKANEMVSRCKSQNGFRQQKALEDGGIVAVQAEMSPLGWTYEVFHAAALPGQFNAFDPKPIQKQIHKLRLKLLLT